MFIKPVKPKSNTQVKSTERKRIRSSISAAFNLSEDDLNKLFPNKGTMNQLKITVHSGQTLTVFTNDKRPMFFEVPGPDETPKKKLFPTVYSLWVLPNLIPTFTTHSAVLPRLAGGADLMLPGVIKQGHGVSTYGRHARDTVVAVNLTSNRSAIGIGTLFRSSEDLYMANNSGICVKMYHVFGDNLWNLEPSVCLQVPIGGPTFEVPTSDDFPSLSDANKHKKSEPKPQQVEKQIQLSENTTNLNQVDVGKVIEELLDNVSIDSEQDSQSSDVVISPDENLKIAFITAIKRMGKNAALPILTSNFYRNHILEVDNNIDLKQTSYKKISKFLNEMAEQNFITLKEETKGVEKITAINSSHPEVVEFILNKVDTGNSTDTTEGLFVAEMKELYFVTNSVVKLFNKFDIQNGEGIEPAQVKKCLKEYVCNNKLQVVANIRNIHVDELLAEVCQLKPEIKTMPFDELLASITDQMKHSYAMRNKNELKTGGKQTAIKMTLAKRSGNKTVTLIDNLEHFGIRLPEFAQACKVGVAASTSITQLDGGSNSKRSQMLVQGNQIRFVYNLLTVKYKIPPKLISGMELAKKEKKIKKK